MVWPSCFAHVGYGAGVVFVEPCQHAVIAEYLSTLGIRAQLCYLRNSPLYVGGVAAWAGQIKRVAKTAHEFLKMTMALLTCVFVYGHLCHLLVFVINTRIVP
jgi:hypothetical protein